MNKNKKYKINSRVVTLGVLAVVILINVFVSLLVQKLPIKLDLTSEKIYEISDDTKKMLAEYDTDVNIYYIAGASYESGYRLIGNVAEVLEKYAQYGPKIKYTSIDSDKNPTFGAKYTQNGENIGTGSVILDSGDRYKVYNYTEFYNTTTNQQGQRMASSMKAEQMINAALRYIASDEEFVAYIIKGHNESELSGMKSKLESENYTVNELNLATEEIPDDAKLIVIGAPKIDYTTSDIAKLDAYFAKAGKAIVTFDYTCAGLTNLYDYLKTWGIAVQDDVAVEQDSKHIISQLGVVLAEYGESDIVSDLADNSRYVGYFPYSKSLQLLFSENNGIKVESVLKTTTNAYTTTDFSELTNTSGSTGEQIIAAMATKQGDSPAEDAIIFVSGNSAMMEVDEQAASGWGFANFDYIRNVFSALQGNYEDYSISPKYLAGGRLMLNELAGLIIGGVFVILVPLAVLVYGIVVWFRRRNL